MTNKQSRQLLVFVVLLAGGVQHCPAEKAHLEPVRISEDGHGFIADDCRPIRFWGFNYDHDVDGRLIEDYWIDEWPAVVADFEEMKELGANVVRIHLQLGKFMKSAETADKAALKQLERLVSLAERVRLYLDITGLGCYHKDDVPEWYDTLNEADRWAVQARFWESVAKIGAGSSAIFCYDLMNEPILPGKDGPETEWLPGDFHGKYFVQYITLDLAGRTRKEVARKWVETLVTAIRRHDRNHLVTVGAIPWAYTFPNAKPLFYSPEAGELLDFVSVHLYPRKDEVEEALDALDVYDVGKPIVIEEMFPLRCGIEQLDQFIRDAKGTADGFIGFYWGKTIDEYEESGTTIGDAIMRNWLEYFRDHAQEFISD